VPCFLSPLLLTTSVLVTAQILVVVDGGRPIADAIA
jgi:hypothetical protein